MIEVRNLCKSYGRTEALRDVSFTVGRPEIVGFLGPNGAGKTTAMKIITTYLAPTSGKVSVDGVDVTEDPLAVRRRIGYLPEKAPLYDDMNVREYLRFVGEARGIAAADLSRRFDWVTEACGVGPMLHKKIHMLSKGYRQRVGLAQALIHDPDVLILDEPTSGLDPLQIIGIRNLIRDLAKTKTVVLSTHILAEITAVSERVLVIHQGRLVADGRYEDLKNTVVNRRRLMVVIEGKPEFAAELKKVQGVSGVELIRRSGGQSFFSLACGRDMVVNTAVADLCRNQNVPLVSLYEDEISLEEVFIALTTAGGDARAKGEQAA